MSSWRGRAGRANAAPLAGRRVLVARSSQQVAALSDRIRILGGIPVEAPVITIEPGDDGALRAAIRDLADGAFELVCLTSPNGVDAVADAFEQEHVNPQALRRPVQVACVGRGTAARLWHRLRVHPDILPERSTTRALGEAIPADTGAVLLPRADIASPVLVQLLSSKGYDCVEVTAYRTASPTALPPEVLDALTDGRIDLIAFGSPSTVRNFVALVGDRPWRGAVVSIGPVTSHACRALGIEVAAEADPHDLEGMTAALVRAAV